MYEWWCPKCGYSHSTPYCPCDEVYRPNVNIKIGIGGGGLGGYEICPHCGQLIKKEVEGC